MMEIGTKRLRGKEVLEEEDTWAQKHFCETVHSGLAGSALEMATAGQCCREKLWAWDNFCSWDPRAVSARVVLCT
nr:hypothetical protein CFP56_65299 [Quercus suber]